MLFSSKTSKTPQNIVDTTVTPPSRSSTTISVLEEEFGMREVPKATTRFGTTARNLFSSFLKLQVLLNLFYFGISRLTTQSHSHSKTQQVHHSGSRAT